MGERSGECVFCAIGSGDAPARFVAEWEDAFAIIPIGPVTPGHTLVIPQVHVADFTESPTVTASVMARAAELATDLNRGFEGGPMNLITSKGREATQSVFHLHVHLVPRIEGDGLALPWTPTGAQ